MQTSNRIDWARNAWPLLVMVAIVLCGVVLMTSPHLAQAVVKGGPNR